MYQPYPPDIPPLTSLRFFAAIGVVIYHYEWFTTQWLTSHSETFDGFQRGVDFFFILSGFVLMHAHRRQIEGNRFRYADFIVRRLARIYPMHVVTLMFFVALVLAFHAIGRQPENPARFDFTLLPAQLLMVNAWGPTAVDGFNFPCWSISAEWFAYLLFPAFAGLVLWKAIGARTLLAATALVVVAAFFLAPVILGQNLTDVASKFGIYRILPEFLLGAVAYRFGAAYPLPLLGRRPVFWAIFAVAIAICAVNAPFLLSTAAFTLLILSAAETARSGTVALSTPGPVYLGEISYSIYMIHIPLATILFKASNAALGETPFWMLWVGAALVVLASAATYTLIERPARAWIIARGSQITRKFRPNPQDR